MPIEKQLVSLFPKGGDVSACGAERQSSYTGWRSIRTGPKFQEGLTAAIRLQKGASPNGRDAVRLGALGA